MVPENTSSQSIADLRDFSIPRKWPPVHSARLQLYAFGTPNGVKIPIALEELGIAYEAHRVPLSDENVKSTEFLSLSPNNKIPAIIDTEGPDGRPIGIFESAAILMYLGDKAGRLFGRNARERYEIMQWLMFQIGSVGPMFGQFGFFYAFGGKDVQDPLPKQRYLDEVKRILCVIDQRLDGRTWIAGDYSIADIAIGPWLQTIPRFYKADAETGLDQMPRAMAYIESFSARPAVIKGWDVFSA